METAMTIAWGLIGVGAVALCLFMVWDGYQDKKMLKRWDAALIQAAKQEAERGRR